MRQCMDADNLHRRLKKIIGQVQAIDRMIDEDVPCEDIPSQLNAAKSALHGCGQVVLRARRYRARRRRKKHCKFYEGRETIFQYELIGQGAAVLLPVSFFLINSYPFMYIYLYLL